MPEPKHERRMRGTVKRGLASTRMPKTTREMAAVTVGGGRGEGERGERERWEGERERVREALVSERERRERKEGWRERRTIDESKRNCS